MTKEVWENGAEGAKMLVEYVKIYTTDYRHQDSNRNEEITNKKRRENSKLTIKKITKTANEN
jgi:hypothetical protein